MADNLFGWLAWQLHLAELDGIDPVEALRELEDDSRRRSRTPPPPSRSTGPDVGRELDADKRSVMLADADGGNSRPLLLDGSCVYDVTLDVEVGLEVWARVDPQPPA